MKGHILSSVYVKVAIVNLVLILPSIFFGAFLDNPGRIVADIAGISFPFLILSALMALLVLLKSGNKTIRVIYTICLIAALPLLCGGVMVSVLFVPALVVAIFSGLFSMLR